MEKTQTITWSSESGKEISVKIEITRAMETEVAYADGYNIELSKKKPVESMVIEARVDGELIGRGYNGPSIVNELTYTKQNYNYIKSQGGHSVLLGKIILKEARHNEIVAIIDSMIVDASQDPEYAVYKGIEIIKVAQQAEAIKEMKQVEVPLYAVEAYNLYAGSSEKAWEDEDETAWALINKWGKYIEAQQGSHPERAKELWVEMSREQNFGIQD